MGQEIPCQLVDNEAVEGLIGIEGPDHPLTVLPHGARGVGMVPVAVGETGQVEPRHGHALAIGLTVQQSVDQLLVGFARVIGEKRIHLVHRGRESDEVEADTSQQCPTIGLGRGSESFLFQSGQDEGIDAVAHPALPLDGGRCGVFGPLVRPMPLKLRPLLNPPTQRLHLRRRQLLARGRRRHVLIGVGARDDLQQAGS